MNKKEFRSKADISGKTRKDRLKRFGHVEKRRTITRWSRK